MISFVSEPLNRPHCDWWVFEAHCKEIPKRDEWYKVEQLQSGLWLCIEKNGRSKKNLEGGYRHDFVVKLCNVEKQQVIWQPSYASGGDIRGYEGLIPDLYHKLMADQATSIQLVDELLQVARGAEPRALDLNLFQGLPGRPADEILLTFKWLLAEEGVNYRTERGGRGRLYPLYRVQELVDGVSLSQVIERCTASGSLMKKLSGVNYQRVDDAILPRKNYLNPKRHNS